MGGGGSDSTHPQIVLVIEPVKETGETQNFSDFA